MHTLTPVVSAIHRLELTRALSHAAVGAGQREYEAHTEQLHTASQRRLVNGALLAAPLTATSLLGALGVHAGTVPATLAAAAYGLTAAVLLIWAALEAKANCTRRNSVNTKQELGFAAWYLAYRPLTELTLTQLNSAELNGFRVPPRERESHNEFLTEIDTKLTTVLAVLEAPEREVFDVLITDRYEGTLSELLETARRLA